MDALLEINDRSRIRVSDGTVSVPGTMYRWNWGLLISIGSGLIAVIVGLFLSTVSQIAVLDIAEPASVLGAFLLLAAFILFYFAAHCMDKVDEAGKAIRREYCKVRNPSALANLIDHT